MSLSLLPGAVMVAASRTATAVIVGCRGRRTGSVSRAVVERAHSTVVVVATGTGS